MTNPSYHLHGGPPYRKVTILQREPGHVGLAAVSRELNLREPGWGGPPSGSDLIVGSPRGRATELSFYAIRVAVQGHPRD